MEIAENVLKKVFAGKHVEALAAFGGIKPDQMPCPFENALVIRFRDNSSSSVTQKSQRLLPAAGTPIDWWALTESCQSHLFRQGINQKWHLPCITNISMERTCECPFVKHISKSKWESLLELFGFERTRYLLTHCIIYVCLASRAWVQVNGSVDPAILKGLDNAYPIKFGVKRKAPSVQEKRGPIHPAVTIDEVIERPRKVARKIRYKNGKSLLNEAYVNQNLSSDSDYSILPPPQRKEPEVMNEQEIPRVPKKIRYSDGMQWHVRILGEDPSLSSSTDSVALSVLPSPAVTATNTQTVGGKKGRRKVRLPKRVDERQAINGSITISHDELLYSSSGYTHFPITHPLCHMRSSDATLKAIFAQPVGGADFGDIVEKKLLIEILNKVRINHQKCPYGVILKKLLLTVPDYDRSKASVQADLVFRFVKCVFNKVFPVELIGGPKNKAVFLRNVSAFIRAGYRTSFTLSGMIESMSTNRVRWLAHLDSLPMQHSFLARCIKWLMVGWLKPLVRQHFYATESAFARNRIFFYSKDVWQRIQNRMMLSMTTVSLRQPLPSLKKSIDDSKLMLHSRLRFVPKRGDSCRPIMPTKFPPEMRSKVTNTRLLLQAISCQYAEGMDAKSTHSLHRKWIEFLNQRQNREPVYFVHADIEDAFGSINQLKLVEILKWHKNRLPSEMALRTFATVSPTGRRSKSFNIIPHLLQSPEDWVARLQPGTVVFDITYGRSSLLNLQSGMLIDLAIKSVCEVQVTALGTGKNCHYRLVRGIPQGSRLSSALCHIYYGHMVQNHLSRFLNDTDLLIRVVDDFLYLTTCGKRALNFHSRIHQGFDDYNAYVNITKTKTNLDMSASLAATENEETPFPPPLKWPVWPSFCGLQFNSHTMEIRGDYDRYKDLNIIHSITQLPGNPGQLLLQRVLGVSTLKIDAVYLDSKVNRKPTVVRNLFYAAIMSAFRFHAIVKHVLMRHRHGNLRVGFLVHKVIVKFCARMVAHVMAIRRRKDLRVRLRRTEISWLCYEAFARTMGQQRVRQLYGAALLPAVLVLRRDAERKVDSQRLGRMRLWIGRRIPRAFRHMQSKCVL